jgi:hypothetical protein
MPAPEIIHKLVARFKENREGYRSGKYNEPQLRYRLIYQRVYELYGLTEDDIRIVEGG